MSQMALFDSQPTGAMPDGASDEWYTPAWLAAWLPSVGFDPCRAAGSAVQAVTWLDVRDGADGLADAWPIGPELDGSKIAFVNPPYSNCAAWVAKCRQEHDRTGATIVALVPCYAGDKYWHRNVWGVARWIGVIAGRVRFDTNNGRAKDAASFTSCLICWGTADNAGAALQAIRANRARANDPPGLFVVDAWRQTDGVPGN